ncbi:MAG: recQ-mediated genome instability protein 1, partial [Paramarteilia canceri]
ETGNDDDAILMNIETDLNTFSPQKDLNNEAKTENSDTGPPGFKNIFHVRSALFSAQEKSFKVFLCNSKVKCIVDRLKHNKGQFWSLKIRIIDSDNVVLDCWLSSKFLENLIGITSKQCYEKKNLAKTDRSTYNFLQS